LPADTKQETWIGQTEFGAFYRKLIDWNPMCSNIMFNGGILGMPTSLILKIKHSSGIFLWHNAFAYTTLLPGSSLK